MIQLNNLKLFFFKNDISMTINNGEVLGVLGPSGCGKTSLLKAIKGFYPKEGTVLLDSLNIDDPKNYKIGFVHQQPIIFPHLSIIDNLIMGNLYIKDENTNTIGPQLKKFIDNFKLHNVLKKSIKNLSVGEKQRLAIVRCLMMNPQVIILDEPSSALDPINIQQLIETIQQLKKYGLSIIIASHDIHFIKKISDKIIFLGLKGNILYQGESEDFWKTTDSFIKKFIDGCQENIKD